MEPQQTNKNTEPVQQTFPQWNQSRGQMVFAVVTINFSVTVLSQKSGNNNFADSHSAGSVLHFQPLVL